MAKPGPKPKKRISGKGYNGTQAASLIYKRQASDGTYEIDTGRLSKAIDDYIASKRDDNGDLTGKYSIPALCKAIGNGAGRKAISPDTLKLWVQGYTNRDHIEDDTYTHNTELAEAIRAGMTEVAIYISEQADPKAQQTNIRWLETLGWLDPAKQHVEVSRKRDNATLRKWGK